MRLIKEINKQPEHIRELFMWLFVIIIFSLVLVAGVRDTNRRIVALVNPQDNIVGSTEVAENNAQSPFASIAGYFGGLKASIADIFNFDLISGVINNKADSEVSPALLPVSGDKN